jgi:hypothetical protein
MYETPSPQPKPLGPLFDTTIQTLEMDEQTPTSGTALLQTWLRELSFYDGLEPVRLALRNLQDALTGNTPDPTHLRVLLAELAEYAQFFARQPAAATPDPAVPDKLRRLADTLQRLLDSTGEVGHS